MISNEAGRHFPPLSLTQACECNRQACWEVAEDGAGSKYWSLLLSHFPSLVYYINYSTFKQKKINAAKASSMPPYNGHVSVAPAGLDRFGPLPCDLVIDETLLQRVSETLVHQRVADEGPSLPQ